MSAELAHIDAHGHAFMVDVTAKELTDRVAYVRGVVAHVPHTVALLGGPDPETEGERSEGASTPAALDAPEQPAGGRRVDAGTLAEARLAGIGAAKGTSELIPLCHPLPLSALEVGFRLQVDSIEVLAFAATHAQTGVEMEALTACAMAAVSLLGSARAHDPLASVEELTLWEKRGGRSGVWQRRGGGNLEHHPLASDAGEQ